MILRPRQTAENSWKESWRIYIILTHTYFRCQSMSTWHSYLNKKIHGEIINFLGKSCIRNQEWKVCILYSPVPCSVDDSNDRVSPLEGGKKKYTWKKWRVYVSYLSVPCSRQRLTSAERATIWERDRITSWRQSNQKSIERATIWEWQNYIVKASKQK